MIAWSSGPGRNPGGLGRANSLAEATAVSERTSQPLDSSAAARLREARAAQNAESVRPVGMIALTVTFALLCGVYAWWFYRMELVAGIWRYQVLSYVLVPEQLLREWCAVPDGRVSVADRVPLLLLAGWIALVAFLLGRLVLSWLSVTRQLERLEYIALATGTGLSGLSLMTLAAGLLGLLDQPLLFAGVGLLVVGSAAWQEWRRAVHGPREDAGESIGAGAARGPQRTPRAVWLGLPFVAAVCAGALLPPIDFDVLEYHLQVPREWVAAGRIEFLAHNVYGNMPLGAESLVALAMVLWPGAAGWWWGALAGKLVMALFTPLTALLLVAAGRRFVSPTAGVIAALLYLSTPWIALVSMGGLNEGVVAFYLLAAVYCAKLWLDQRHAEPRRACGYLWLAGWMAGSAAACKYPAAVFVALPLLVVVLVTARREYVRSVSACAIAMFLAGGLWYAKNWVQTGNPVYPLMAQVFDSRTRTPEKNAQFRRAHRVPVDAAGRAYAPRQAWESLQLVLGRSLWHSPLLIPGVALVVLRRRTRQQSAPWLLVFVLLVGLWWLFTHRIDRFLVPGWPCFALAAGVGLTWSEARVWRVTMWSVIGFGLAANWVLITSPLLSDNRYLVQLEQLRDDPRLSTTTVAHRFLNAHVPSGQRALLIGDAAVFPLRVPVLYSTCFDDSLLDDVLRCGDREGRRAKLAELNISHIYVNWAEIARYRQPGNYGFPASVTRELMHGELALRQRLIRPVRVPELDPRVGEIFEVLTAAD